MSDWSGMLKDQFRQIGDGSWTLENQMDVFSRRRNPFESLAERIKTQVERQRIIYKNVFPKSILDGFDLDFEKFQITGFTPESNRVLVIAGGFVSNNQAFEANSRRFPCWRYTEDLDQAIIRNDRDASKGGYIVFFRDRQEADEELKNLSADALEEQGISGITLLERQWYELIYFDEKAEHLDIHNWTLCAGSRSSGDSVPNAVWNDDKFRVDWNDSDYRYDGLRARAAVPCLPRAN